MYGTVVPLSVVVVATSGGGLLGSYAENAPVTDDLYSYSYFVGALHCGSFDLFWQSHGWTCGPEKTGPPFAWSTSVWLARPPVAVAVSRLAPSCSPVTRPS